MTSLIPRSFWLSAVAVLLVAGCSNPCSDRSPEDAPAVERLHFGTYHVCVLDEAKKVWCTGKNDHGQLGDGSTADQNELAEVRGIDDMSGIAVGLFDTTCAWNDDGALYCWGSNEHGVLADDDLELSATPVEIKEVPPVVDVTVGAFHACALTENADVYCWGNHAGGQLGIGDGDQKITTPTRVESLEDVEKVRAGGEHTCALLQNGEIHCWGSNEKGQIGIGLDTQPTVSTPQNISSQLPFEAVDLEVAFHHSCALVGDKRQLFCWGGNDYGQFGLDDLDLRDVPTEVPEIAYVDELAVGGGQVCARIDGEVFCAGEVLRPVEAARESGEGYFFRPSDALKQATEMWSGVLAICGSTDRNAIACRGVQHQGLSGDIF